MLSEALKFGDSVRGFDLELWKARRAFNKVKAGFFSTLGQTLTIVPLKNNLVLAAELNKGTSLGAAYSLLLTRYSQGLALIDVFRGLVNTSELQVLRAMQAAMKSDKDLANGFTRLAASAHGAGLARAAVFSLVSKVSLFGVVFLISAYMVHSGAFPTLVKLFPVGKWSSLSRFIYFSIEFMFRNLAVTLLCLTALVATFAWSVPNWVGAYREYLDDTPLYRWYRDFMSTQTLISMAMQLASGAGAGNALRELIKESNKWERAYLQKMLQRNESGIRGGEIFNVGYFPMDVTTRLVLLAQSGDTVAAFIQIGIESQDKLIKDFVKRMNDASDSGQAFFKALIGGLIVLLFTLIGEYMATVLGF